MARRDNAPGRLMLDIATGVVKAGGETRTASRDHGVTSGCHKLIHAIGSRLSDCEGLLSRQATIRLCNDIAEWNTDIVHLHNIHGHYINYPYLFGFLRDYGCQVVWTLHDCWAFTGHCAYYHARGCRQWQTGCGECEATREYPSSFGRDMSARNHERKRQLLDQMSNLTIVCVSDWLASQARQSFLTAHDIVTIKNGVDTKIFKPDKKMTGINDGKYHIIAVASNWKRNKGLDTISEIRRQLPADVELEVVSGIRNPHKLAKVYASADLLINPSLEEAFGMTPVEAMSCGTPVIVNDNTAQRETVTTATGRIVDFNNLDAVMGAIEEMKQLGKDRFSEACRRHVTDNYSLTRMTERYIDLFRKLMP
ncbi:MAG: glycosyltransferase [Pseudoflavonifractor sp.]|nr:glycosyltransferase [Pseudoflavonifractor sp.]